MTLPIGPGGVQPGSPDLDCFAGDLATAVDGAFAPDEAALRRVRAQVAVEFRLQAAARSGGRRVRPGWFTGVRRAAALALALGLVAGSFGLVAANSGPGQPFYGLRLAAEELTLPAPGEARVRAQLARLEDRLAEALEEAQAGDPGGVAAALDAYRAELSQALSESNASTGGVGPLLNALTAQEVVLEALLSVVPASARSGLDRAIEQVGHAEDVLLSRPTPSPSPGGPAADPGGTPDPSVTQRPGRTPHPTGKPPDVGGPSATPPGAGHRPSQSPGPP